jgi:hypothetical protein
MTPDDAQRIEQLREQLEVAILVYEAEAQKCRDRNQEAAAECWDELAKGAREALA